MNSKFLLIITLLFCLLSKAQNLNDDKIMGVWKAVSVEIPNATEISQKEAIKFMEDAFLGSLFNFKGNKVFKIEYGKKADERIKELFFLDEQNWVIENDQIKIGTKNDGFSAMHITFQDINGKTYFALPMMRLEMNKISDDKPSKEKVITSKKGIIEHVDYSKAEIVTKDIDASQIIAFKDIENPPLAPECKSKWDIEKKKKCTSNYISKFVARKFNTDLAGEAGISGKMRINIEFVIDTNGRPINITATGGPEIINQNAIEVIGLLPDLKPGTIDGQPINVSYKMPLIFQVAD